MQRPTFTNLRVRTARDAEILFHAVALGMLPMITRRLDSEERMALTTGCVYVWEERTSVVSDSLEHGKPIVILCGWGFSLNLLHFISHFRLAPRYPRSRPHRHREVH